jgi:hypothetical protein
MVWPCLCLVVGVGLFGCTNPTGGSAAPVGSFLVQGTLESVDCSLEEAPDGGSRLSLSISRAIEGTDATLQLSGYDRPGTLVGQQVQSRQAARRVFSACPGCDTALEESLLLELYSVSQAEAVGGQCPKGLPPAPVTDSARPLELKPLGSDALLACGALEVRLRFEPDGGTQCAACDRCRFSYTLQGIRQ